jgi:hypothetical protein
MIFFQNMASISKKQFIEFMPSAIQLITKGSTSSRMRFMDGIANEQLNPAVNHLQTALEYNLPGGKHAR